MENRGANIHVSNIWPHLYKDNMGDLELLTAGLRRSDNFKRNFTVPIQNHMFLGHLCVV